MPQNSTVIAVNSISKRFVIHKEKSLKERLINLRNREFTKEDFWALKDVSFDVPAGQTVGLIGANGSGKSTMLKIIGGIIQPTTGEVRRRGRLAALLELGAGFHGDLTGRENVYLNAAILGLSRSQTDKYFEPIVDFSGIEQFIDTPVKFYSSGMYVRLAFSVAVHVDPEILLVDEVLAVGDEPFQRKCIERIQAFRAEGRTIVLVSHSADAIGQICDRGIVLQHGVEVYDGDPAEALRQLRRGFSADEADEEEASAPEPAIESVRMTTSGGDFVRPGDDIEFEIVVDSHGRELSDWVVGIGIETPLGQVVYGTNTKLLAAPATTFTGKRTVRFTLPNVRLASGQYPVQATLGTIEHGSYVRVREAALVDARTDQTSAGVLAVDARCEIEPPH